MAVMQTPALIAYERLHFYDDQTTSIILGAVAAVVLVIPTTVLRLIARRQRKAPLLWDDWLIVFATVSIWTLFYFCGCRLC